MDNAHLGSLEIAEGKAKTAVNLRRPTVKLQEAVAKGGDALRLLGVEISFPA